MICRSKICKDRVTSREPKAVRNWYAEWHLERGGSEDDRGGRKVGRVKT
jgi:hypothetical protein